jgi:hypothetical protein
MINGNFVFDIDGAIAIAVDYQPEKVEKGVKEKFGEAFYDKYCLSACNYPHYIFPGYYAFFKWLHDQGGKIIFFSSGVELRNVELTEKLMRLSFGDDFPNVEYKVFSRQHCIDTTSLYPYEETQEKYQSFFYGQKKKKLGGIVVPEAEMSNSLLIDDDTSYMVKGEEFNFVYVRAISDYLPYGRDNEAFIHFHKAYYLTGLLSTMFELMDKEGISLMEAAKRVQIDAEGAELSRNFYYPSTKRTAFYTKGLAILQQIDPSLQFYYDMPEKKEV